MLISEINHFALLHAVSCPIKNKIVGSIHDILPVCLPSWCWRSRDRMSCMCACCIESIREVSAACLIGRTGDHTEQYMHNHHDDGSHDLHQERNWALLCYYSSQRLLESVLYGIHNIKCYANRPFWNQTMFYCIQSVFVCTLFKHSIELQEYRLAPTNSLIDSFHAQILNQCLPGLLPPNTRLKQEARALEMADCSQMHHPCRKCHHVLVQVSHLLRAAPGGLYVGIRHSNHTIHLNTSTTSVSFNDIVNSFLV